MPQRPKRCEVKYARKSGLKVFLSSLLSSLGGVFSSRFYQTMVSTSRAIVPPYQQCTAGGEVMNNRRALMEIGNLVPEPESGAIRLPKCRNSHVVAAAATMPHDSEEEKEKNQAKAFSSVLSARSKAACGLSHKLVENIDLTDMDNELAATEYIDDIYEYYKLTEEDGCVHDYMTSQPDINANFRSILVDWLVEVHSCFKLMPETFYLTINIVDRFLSMKAVHRKELQLIGITSMLIASKYEEIWEPTVNNFVSVTDNTYVREQVLVMEKTILNYLDWYFTVPTPYVFLVRYIKASTPSNKVMENMVFFLAELGMMHYPVVSMYSPSVIAASAVYAARCTLHKSPFWTETLKHCTSYSEEQLRECAKLMVNLHAAAPESKLSAVYKKFCSLDRCSVALLHVPAKNVLS